MAGCALLRRGLVEEHGFTGNTACQFVAGFTLHVAVGPLQRKCGRLVVIEQGRLPLPAVVAPCARGCRPLGELPAMRVFVAVLALGWGSLEINIDQLRLQVRRLVTVDAGRGAVRSEQREGSLRVVEPRQFLPGLGGMAGLASGRLAIGTKLLHAVLELPFVWIGVAAGAIEV